MNSHNPKAAFDFHKTPVLTEEVRIETDVVSKSLTKSANLAIADDIDDGCDPYNSTGQHVVIKTRLSQKN